MSTIAIITARGGSKRIPRKNVKEFLGKPILQYSVAAALESGVFDEVMVSTDDVEIAGIAESLGARVPFMRSEATSNDYAVTADVVEEVLTTYEQDGRRFEYACCIYPTAPFLKADALRSAMNILIEKQADSVVPVVRFSFPPQRGCIITDGKLRFAHPEHMNTRSQDLEPMYHDCGQFYCLNTKAFRKQRRMVMEDTVPYIQDEMYVQDIDTEDDWRIAEMKMSILRDTGYGGK